MIHHVLKSAIVMLYTFGISSGESLKEAVAHLRSSAMIPADSSEVSSPASVGSLIEVHEPRKPLSVAEFTEWLHNLYYTEQQKRESAIKTLLEADPLT